MRQPARYAGRRDKTFDERAGAADARARLLPLRRRARAGFCPRDRALGLQGASLSPGVLRMVGRVGAMVSFAEGHELLRELAGVDVPTKHVERAAEALGREIAEDERRVVEPPPADEPVAPTLYLGMDGTGVPMRAAELAGRAGKQPDGSAKTREVKLCTVWSAEGRDEEGTPVRDAGSVSYSAAIESAAQQDTDEAPSEFAARVEREAARRGFERAARRVVLGDGATWIWNLAERALPRRHPDRRPLPRQAAPLGRGQGHLRGGQRPGPSSGRKQRHDELDAGDIDAVLRALRVHRRRERRGPQVRRLRRRATARACATRSSGRQGLCTSTGVVEAGCKVAIGTRCKRAGMHWTVAGADAIIALRCCKLSGRFEDFWERRAQPAGRWPHDRLISQS